MQYGYICTLPNRQLNTLIFPVIVVLNPTTTVMPSPSTGIIKQWTFKFIACQILLLQFFYDKLVLDYKYKMAKNYFYFCTSGKMEIHKLKVLMDYIFILTNNRFIFLLSFTDSTISNPVISSSNGNCWHTIINNFQKIRTTTITKRF